MDRSASSSIGACHGQRSYSMSYETVQAAESSPRSLSEMASTEWPRGSSLMIPSLPPLESAEALFRCATRDNGFGRSKTKSKPLASMSRQELPICYDFVQGKCRRLNCRYLHDFGAVIRHNARESRVCFDHLRGECTRGSLCRFSHDIRRLVLQGMEEATYHVVIEPTANGICYDFCRGACPRRGKCPWTHNLIEIAWNTAKQPLLDCQKIDICRKVLNVIKNACPQELAEPAIHRMISQPSFRLKILSLNVTDEPIPSARTDLIISATTSPDSLSICNPPFFSGLDVKIGGQNDDYSHHHKFVRDNILEEGSVGFEF